MRREARAREKVAVCEGFEFTSECIGGAVGFPHFLVAKKKEKRKKKKAPNILVFGQRSFNVCFVLILRETNIH